MFQINAPSNIHDFLAKKTVISFSILYYFMEILSNISVGNTHCNYRFQIIIVFIHLATAVAQFNWSSVVIFYPCLYRS